MSATLNEEKCISLLTPDHEGLLRLLVRQEFCRIGLHLAPFLSDLNLDTDDPDLIELTFADPEAEKDTALTAELHTLLATSTLGKALGCAGIAEGDRYTALAESGLHLLLGKLTGLPRSLRPRRY